MHEKSTNFRRTDLVALLFVALALFTLALPAADTAQDAARRIQCQNNLKQIGLAVHNFHDTYNGLPPLSIGEGRASFFVSMMPFAEATNIYNVFNGGNAKADTKFADKFTDNWGRLAKYEKDAVGAVKWMHCPMRRASSKIQLSSSEDANYQGPVGDYCVVFLDSEIGLEGDDAPKYAIKDAAAEDGWKKHLDPCDAPQVGLQKGAIRLAFLDCAGKKFDTWKPRDTFARVTDGTANTVLVGEKHLRASELRKYADDQNQQDGVYMFESDKGREFNITRNIRLPLGKMHKAFDEKGQGPGKDFGFGSQHETGVNFLFADGHVQSFAFDTDASIMARLGHAQDGYTIKELE